MINIVHTLIFEEKLMLDPYYAVDILISSMIFETK